MPIQVQTPNGLAEFPDEMSPAEIEAVLRQQFPPETEGEGRGLMDRALDVAEDWAPTVGAMAGGAAGAAGGLVTAPVTAAMGGAAGTGVRNLIRGLRSGKGVDLSETAGEMATEGAKQGAMELAGGAAGRALKGVGTRLYSGLLKPSKAIRREFPTVVDDLIQNKRLITPGGWFGGGLRGAEDDVAAAAAKADDLIRQAAPTAPTVQPREIIGEFGDVVQAVRDRVRAGVVPEGELAKVGERGRRLVRTTRTGPGLEITEAQRLKKAAQDAAAGAYRQMRAGNIRQLGTEDLLDAATARGLKGALEAKVPGLRAANQATQRLIGQERALADAVGRTGNHLPFGSVSDLAAMGAGAAGGPLTGLAAKASTMAGPGSAAAIALYQAGKLPYAQLLRILAQQAGTDEE